MHVVHWKASRRVNLSLGAKLVDSFFFPEDWHLLFIMVLVGVLLLFFRQKEEPETSG